MRVVGQTSKVRDREASRGIERSERNSQRGTDIEGFRLENSRAGRDEKAGRSGSGRGGKLRALPADD